MRARRTRRRGEGTPLLVYAAVCYLPLVLRQWGWVSADTKTYLYLDPGRLLGRAWSMWDPSVGLGTVSHQTIGYLWPMGPWYWAMERLGLPDWLAQRLWWATLLFVAGAGVAHLLRRLDWPAAAVWPAVFLYGLSPYVLTHIGRLSAVLLPFVGLPWLLAFAIDAVRRQGWRHPALFALTVTTVGSVNLTALLLVLVAPVLWMAWVVVAERVPLRRALSAGARISVLTVTVSAWWLAGLSVQATHGIDIVRFTETAETVAVASSGHEVLRGLGYWFFYGGDQLDLWVSASVAYTQWLWLLGLTFAQPAVAFLAAATARWSRRGFFVVLLVVGTLLAVGAHRWDDPSPLGRVVRSFLGTDRGLAFRSLPRAVPLVALASAVLLAGGLLALRRRRPRLGRALQVATCAAAVVMLVPLWQGTMVGDTLRRKEVPDYWLEAARTLDAGDDGTRVLELPGIDFSDYRWGATVDPITPGLVDRPYVAREHVPYGSVPSAELLNALDLGLQERTMPSSALAPVARLLRAGELVLRNDLQYERYNTARPRLVWDLVQRAGGLGPARELGPDVEGEPDTERQLLDETWLERETSLELPAAVAIVPVEDQVPIVSTKPAASPLLVAGDGTGIVDAAGAGLIDGHELIRYSGSLGDSEIRDELDGGARVLVTDTNRRRAERWSTIRHTQGYTETADHRPLSVDPTDNRLTLFPDAGPSTATVAEHRGGITARATSYGNPIAYAGEQRPLAAVDGDPTTSWQTGAFSDARGERLVIDLTVPLTTDRVRLLQPIDSDSNRSLTVVGLRLDGGPRREVALDVSSLSAPGQLVTFPEQEVSRVEIELLADSAGDRPRFGGAGAVGFAEVMVGDGAAPTATEVIRVPSDLVRAAGRRLAEAPLAFLFTRLRQDPTDVTRDDEERAVVRAFDLPVARDLPLAGSARLSARAPAEVIDELLGQRVPGVDVATSSTLVGSLRHRPVALLDGDPTTWWASEFGQTRGAFVEVSLEDPHRWERLDLSVVTDGRHSVPTELVVSIDGQPVARPVLDLPTETAEGRSTVTVALPPTSGRHLQVEVAAAREVTSVNWNSGDPLAHPVGIAELGAPGIQLPPSVERLDTGCRDDLLTVDGAAVPVRITGTAREALAGEPLRLEGCAPVHLPVGDHLLVARPGLASGLDLDQLVLGALPAAPTGAVGEVEVRAQGPDHVRVEVPASDAASWVVLGQSHNVGWRATVSGAGRTTDLGEPQLVDGFANGWLLPASDEARIVDLRFEPQRRVDLALVLSALAALVCILLALRRGRGPAIGAAGGEWVEDAGLPDAARWQAGTTVSWPVALVAGVGLGGAACLVVPPLVGALAAVLSVAALRSTGAARALALAPAGLLALIGTYVVVSQARHHILPGLEWPQELDRAHPVAMTALVLLASHTVVSALRERRR